MRGSQFVWTCAVVLAAAVCRPVTTRGQDLVAPTEARSPEEERRAFKLPPGFEAQLVAAEPDVNKPMNMAFDAKGRLWVTSTVEYPYPAPPDRKPRDTVKVLEDFDDNGRARKVTTFADGLNIPLGVLPLPDCKSALVYAIDKIYRLADTDGDGRADKQDVVLGTYGFKDTHGMTNSFTVGFDGWVYACHGFANDSVVRAADGSEVRMNSGNVYRFKPDGSRVELFTRGQVNPFGLCFDPFGNLYSADCHSRPQYLLLRGAVYPSFGKPDDGLGFGPEMIFHDHGSTGIAGSLYYDAGHFPAKYRGTLFNGNPVTGRINHDTLEWRGSSPRAIEQPDFMTSDDPWFRPVDIKLGPDGAMWVADFYNRIIGHYEVRLDHPGRDRESGRIWRIVYKGDGGTPAAKVPDLTAARPDELLRLLGQDNLSVRMAAATQLASRPADDALTGALAAAAVAARENPAQRVHLLWLVHHVGDRHHGLVAMAAKDGEAVVRTHAMRVLSEVGRQDWTRRHQDVALAGLVDKDARVRRAAADALARHPDPRNVRHLLDARAAAPSDDTHLVHALRIALRNQLEPEGNLAQLPLGEWGEADRRAIADVALGVSSPDVAGFLVEHVEKYVTDDRQLAARFLRHAARFLPGARVDALAALATGKFGEDVDFQLALFRSVREGLALRGAAPTEGLRKWGANLAERLLAAATPDADTWTRRPLPGRRGDSKSPWIIQVRPSADGNAAAPFWSSLPPGGEQLTGVLRSEPFVAPKELSFFMAGHNGPPGEDDVRGNFVRVLDAKTNETIAEALPPRDDAARKVTFDLSRAAGRKVVFEATDGNDGDGYAWLAFGRFEPAVVKLPSVGPDVVRDRQAGAAEIAGALKLTALEKRLADLVSAAGVDATARAAAARALASINPDGHVKALGAIAADPEVPPALRDAVAAALGELNTEAGRAEILAAMAAAPRQLQRTLALALAGTRDGAAALLAAVESGKASARLLQDPAVRERLSAAGAADVDARVDRLTRNLPAAGEELEKLIQQRRASFDPAAASAERGAQVFATHCAACHKINDVGATIGPQLDGLGKRGVDRVLEDVLDPNRNVDAAFRVTILRLKGGDSAAGLLRREEGELLVLADSAGKEQSVPKAQVERRAVSPLSPMPTNFGELLSPQELNDLVAFLTAN